MKAVFLRLFFVSISWNFSLSIDLVENTYSLGRLEIATKQFPREVYIACSKHHLEIWRKQIEVMGALTTQIYISDRSSNGTFVNGHLLKKKTHVLKSNDVIGLPVYKKPGSCYEGNTNFLGFCDPYLHVPKLTCIVFPHLQYMFS